MSIRINYPYESFRWDRPDGPEHGLRIAIAGDTMGFLNFARAKDGYAWTVEVQPNLYTTGVSCVVIGHAGVSTTLTDVFKDAWQIWLSLRYCIA